MSAANPLLQEPYFEFSTDHTMQGLRHFWKLHTGTGDVLAVSRGYSTHSSALRAAKRMKVIIPKAEIPR